MERDAVRQDVLGLFEAHGGAVYRFALVLLRHREDAEDVLQETFVKLLNHVRGGGAATNLRGWLFTVAANGCRDRMRRRSRWIPWSVDHDAAVQPPALEDEDGRIAAARSALAQLAPRDRLLVALRAQGLSYGEIAAGAGVRPVSVGRLLARALERWERAYAAQPLGARPDGLPGAHETRGGRPGLADDTPLAGGDADRDRIRIRATTGRSSS